MVEVKKALGHKRLEKYRCQGWPSVDVKLREAMDLVDV